MNTLNHSSSARTFRTETRLVCLTLLLLSAAAPAQELRRHNPPVFNVAGQFYAIPTDADRQLEVKFGDYVGHGPWGKDHYQGIVRHGDFLYLTSSYPNGSGRILVMKLTYEFFGVKWFSPKPVNEIFVPEYWHLGGMDVSGDYLAVAAENDTDGAVLIYDLSDGQEPRLVHEYERKGKKLGAVGMTELYDGRMAIATLGAEGWINVFTSNDEEIESPDFTFEHAGTVPLFDPDYQSLSLVTQTDGEVFLLGTFNTDGGLPTGEDHIRCMQLSTDLEPQWFPFYGTLLKSDYGTLHIDLWDSGINLDPQLEWKTPNFAGGGGVFVNEYGGLEVWACPHGNRAGGELRISTTY